ncbi:hypothetical protein PYCCODRAFT_332344 [Trametes coccinea BRFM310]|uniref:Uncharacterized protein n=1 Tax=Trametes coccinea (strain BRFM310) TaxID=1353009 RepID=A0A1Y2INI5_TRAC3|nr:hypothetical protein PYCCODRAFT_332344 [Trametes coccinea BRFM310]
MIQDRCPPFYLLPTRSSGPAPPDVIRILPSSSLASKARSSLRLHLRALFARRVLLVVLEALLIALRLPMLSSLACARAGQRQRLSSISTSLQLLISAAFEMRTDTDGRTFAAHLDRTLLLHGAFPRTLISISQLSSSPPSAASFIPPDLTSRTFPAPFVPARHRPLS